MKFFFKQLKKKKNTLILFRFNLFLEALAENLKKFVAILVGMKTPKGHIEIN